jgi:hypothetical protein
LLSNEKTKHYIVTTQEDQVILLKKNVAGLSTKNSPLNELLKVCYPKQNKEINAIKFLMIKIHSHQAQNPITIDVDNFRSNPSFNAELSELN